MTNLIELTGPEYRAAFEAARQKTGEGFRDSMVVEAIVKAINELRAGDPPNTLRKAPSSRTHALRDAEGWTTLNSEGKPVRHFKNGSGDARAIEKWDLVYKP